ncbi:hypothetical protein [Spirillospora sp. NPDC047279]|uniref:hypothetical protein n=1 Tax=Spirillospora sp. NPDC047279 TaxID=3155478 RepID=UPI0033E3BECE
MLRIVCGAVLVTVLVTVGIAGCGAEAAPPPTAVAPEASLSAAVLSGTEVAAGYAPAENQRVFEGMEPADPDCARLLRLADVEGARDITGAGRAPEAHAAFYRASPVASLAQHVLRLPAGLAAEHVVAARKAVVRCPKIVVESGDGDIRLRRDTTRKPRALKDALAVRYANKDISLEVVMAAVGDDLLVVAAPGSYSAASGPRTTERIAVKAIKKLRAVHAGRIPLTTPAPPDVP